MLFFSSLKPAEKVTLLVVNMIVEDLLPIATVDYSDFRKLVSFLAPGYTLQARKSIVLRLEAKHNGLTQRAIDKFKSPDIVGVGLTTAYGRP